MKLGENCSTCLNISCGIPQGAVLGPKLIVPYINVFCKVSHVAKVIFFADDVNVFCSGSELQLVYLMIWEMLSYGLIKINNLLL